MKNSISHQALTSLFWMFFGSTFQLVLRVLNLMVLARMLSPEEFGQMTAALVIVGFSIMVSSFGVGPALIQKKNLPAQAQKAGYTISVVLGILASIIVFVFSLECAEFMSMPEIEQLLQALSICFLFRSLSVLSESRLQRELKFKQVTIIDSVSYFFGYFVISILLALLGYGVWSLVIAFITQSLIRSFIFIFLNSKNIGLSFHMESYKNLFRFGSMFSFSELANYAATQADNVIIGKGLGSVELGEYSRAYQIMVLPVQLIGQVVSKVLFPAMAKLQSDKDRLAIQFRRSLCLSALISLPVSAIFLILAPEIIHILLGDGWAAVILPFQVLSVCLVFRMGYKMADQVAKATGDLNRRLYIQVIYAFLVIFFSWVGLAYGVVGVAAGVACAVFVNYILSVILAVKITGLSIFETMSSHVPGLGLLVVSLSMCIPIASYMRSHSYDAIFVLLASVFSTFILSLLFLRFLPAFLGKDIFWIMRLLSDRIPNGYLSRLFNINHRV